MNIERFGKGIATGVIPVWAALMTLVVSSLMVGHWISLPHPAAGMQLDSLARTAKVSAETTPASECSLSMSTPKLDVPELTEGESRAFHAFHILYGNCPCSRRVLDRLVKRHAIEAVAEHIVLIGEDPEHQAKAIALGYDVRIVTPTQLKSEYGIEAAPLLIVSDESGRIFYSGGYTERKQGLAIQDQVIIQRVLSGEHVEHLPLYGCAVSQGLKAIIDPLGLT